MEHSKGSCIDLQPKDLTINVQHMILKHIPNALTLLRLILIIPFLIYLYHEQYVNAFYVFLLAGFTDGLDGWLARHFSWQSYFGSFVDPLADKLLVASSFISLALIGSLPWWLVALVFFRDLSISIGVLLWLYFVQHSLEFAPSRLSKLNTTLQIMLVTLCLFEQAYTQFPSEIKNGLIILTTLTTVTSYIDYLYKAWSKKATVAG